MIPKGRVAIMQHITKCYVISAVTYYATKSKLWLPDTFVIILFVIVVCDLSGILVSSLPIVHAQLWDMCGIYETCM